MALTTGNPRSCIVLWLSWKYGSVRETPLCDKSTGRYRQILSKHYRRNALNTLHSLSHPGVRATSRLIVERFCSPGMNKDVSEWAHSCVSRQTSKMIRHNKHPLGLSKTPDARFGRLHLDLLRPSEDPNKHFYFLTYADGFTRWSRPVPIKDIIAEMVARSFVKWWVANFRRPSPITRDHEHQFKSAIFRCLTTLLGITRFRAIACHRQAICLVEQFHGRLKASLSAANASQWTDALPLILLGILNAIKADTGYTAAQIPLRNNTP